MARMWSILPFVLLAGTALGASPVAGGFMTGKDSAVYVYWFHPETQVWEQGIDDDGTAFDVFPAFEPGFCSMAQRISLPNFSFVTTFSERLYLGDHYPEFPGNQFSPFGFSVYLEGDDSLPARIPILSDRDSLLPENVAGDGWMYHRVDISDLTGDNLWFSHDWDYDTPTAPEIKALRIPVAAATNKIGTGPEGDRQWNGLEYLLVFQYRFLTLIAPDVDTDGAWRKAGTGTGPEGFLITRYASGDDKATNEWCSSADTLLQRLPDGPTDSVSIRAGCDGETGEDALTLAFDPARVLPITVEADCGEYDSSSGVCECILSVISASLDTVELLAGYDWRHVQIPSKRITIPPSGTVAVSATISQSAAGSRRQAILLEDAGRPRYPYLIIVECQSSGHTAVETAPENHGSKTILSVCPNPVTSAGMIRLRTATSQGRIEIFNILGQRVAGLPVNPGGETVWDERDERGRLLPSGVYLVRLVEGRGLPATARVIIVR
ncbi:MAG: T9SS type A sorting domain-containing protein [candidate division Zixibacteria bacterium]|nr:T9SS type A sorting domain-containing protein [candidate division Zixibacteria bacterium]